MILVVTLFVVHEEAVHCTSKSKSVIHTSYGVIGFNVLHDTLYVISGTILRVI